MKNILIVEDEETLANIMESKLKKAGYSVRVAGNGQEGLRMIEKETPDLLLLDIMLPVVNGYQILEELHKKNILPKLPVIVISNSGQQVEIDKILGYGVRDYLVKINFSPEEVLEKVEQVFSGESVPGTAESAHSAKILIVEDDMILVDLLEKKFKKENFFIYKTLGVNEARKVLKEKPDIILLDVLLPDTDGFTFLQEIKADPKYKDIPVVIISNFGQKEEIEKGMNLGAVDYIIKANVLPQEIVDKVSHLLRRKQIIT